ncbi:VOC family protein [Nonomuraea sp. LPB2021202275-12-8]|uniref:VOC family protein n=1 Tax=Nonomuraea sp. LPB2021202275-12-8 TaxID=3120159 RepID=UPI00300D1BE2
MAERTSYPDGEPCWAQLLTRDAAAAQSFYTELFGWDCRDQGGWTMCHLDGRPVAAITPDPRAAEPPAWTVYLATSDLGAAMGRLEVAGGKLVEGPLEGYALATDPGGARFALFQPGPFAGAGVRDEPGAMSWAEVNSPDGQAADAFYATLFGYEREQVPGGVDYSVYKSGGRPVCGRLRMDEHWEGVPSHWMIYFDVADMDAATARVTELGGEVPVPPFDSPFGRIAVVAHPAAGFLSLRRPPG